MDEKRQSAGRRKRARGRWSGLPGWLRRTVYVLAVVVLAPYALVPVFAVVNPPVSALMLVRAVQGRGLDYRWTDFSDIAPSLPATVVMSEDGRFCSHHGVDWEAVQTVIDEFGEGGELRGASTITMQTAKNLFLPLERSYLRKAFEVPMAYWLELVWSKRRIIEVYLNIVEWGPGIYGAEAAARYHFKRPASRLGWRQSALLAAALPNPILRTAGRPGPLTRRLADGAEQRGRQAGAYVDCIR